MSFKSSLDLYCHPLIIELFWFTKLWFRIEEKIHTKAVTNVFRDTVLEVVLPGRGGGVTNLLDYHYQTWNNWHFSEIESVFFLREVKHFVILQPSLFWYSFCISWINNRNIAILWYHQRILFLWYVQIVKH